MENQLGSKRSFPKSKLDKQAIENWTRVAPLIEDYFDFMIMDILKGVYAELVRQTAFEQITCKLKTAFLSFWKNFVTSPIDSKLGWEYRQYFLKILKSIPDFDEVTNDFVLNTITQMGLEIQQLFRLNISPSKGVQCILNEEFLHNLECLVNDYIQMTYFDHFILGQALKVIFYTESYTFGEVYELRQKLNEFFRNFIHGLNNLTDFKTFISKISEKMPISDYKMELFAKILLAHFTTVLRNQNRKDLRFLEIIKTQIRHRTNLIKTNLGFQTPSNIDQIRLWLSQQIEQILLYENLPESEMNDVKAEIESLFIQFVNHKIDLKQAIHLINKEIHIGMESNPEPPKNRYEELFNRISYEQEDIMGIEAQAYPHSAAELFKALIYMVNESMEVDPSLENLIELISQIQNEDNPGEDGFYI